MKPLLLAPLMALGIVLTGCGHSQHGLRIYTPTSATDAKGNTNGGTALLLSANADMPGVKRIKTPDVEIEFDTTVQGTRTVTTTDPKTGNIITEVFPVLAGLFTSEVTRAQGVADKSRIDATSAGATGAALSFATAAAAGPAAGAIPKP